jgi:hypothetical protein
MTRFATIASALAAALVTTAASAQPATGTDACVGGPVDATAFTLAQGVVETMIPPDKADAMVQDLMRGIMNQMKQGFIKESTDKGMQEILDRQLKAFPDRLTPLVRKHMPAQKAAMACAYVREFSMSELRDISAFAQSSSGSHYLSRSTAIISDPSVAAANQAYFSEATTYLDAFRDDLVKELAAYANAKNAARKR